MDAHAHLLSLGWAGPGHSLDSRPHKGRRGLAYDPKQSQNNGNGLIKPLLISQKKNAFGIGKKAHEPAAGNEWWLKGFETALSNVGRSESERTSGTATPEFGRPTNGYTGKHAGLYGFFVKGGEMEGTTGLETETKTASRRRKKRKSDALDSQDVSSSSSASEEPQVGTGKRCKSKKGTQEFELVGAFLQARDKDEKRRHRKQKTGALEEFQQVGEFFEAGSSRGKASPSGLHQNYTPESIQDVTVTAAEDSEQDLHCRKTEREMRGAGKAAKIAQSLQVISDRENAPAVPAIKLEDNQHVGKNVEDATMAKAARKAERKRRKELARK